MFTSPGVGGFLGFNSKSSIHLAFGNLDVKALKEARILPNMSNISPKHLSSLVAF